MCFLKGAYKGQFGVVSTKDANGKITILAVAFVPTEDGKEWVWFMGKVIHDFPSLKITISDRLKGWDEVEKFLESSHVQHTNCILHLKDNALDMARTKKLPGYPGNLRKDIVCAAKITETGRFNKEMEKIYTKSPEIGKFFGTRSRLWSSAVLINNLVPPIPRQGDVTSNTVEVCNKMLLAEREMNIVDAIKSLYAKTVDKYRFGKCEAFRMMQKKQELTDWALNNIAFEREKSYGFKVYNYGVHQDSPQLHNFQVTVNNLYEYAVQLNVVTGKICCPCKFIVEFGLPCRHAIPCIDELARTGMTACDSLSSFWSSPMYHVSTLLQQHYVPPVAFSFTRNDFEQFPLLPPVLKYTIAGKKRKKRFKSRNEEGAALRKSGGKNYRCGLCGKDGHNKSTCRRVDMKESINRNQAFKKFLDNGVVDLIPSIVSSRQPIAYRHIG